MQQKNTSSEEKEIQHGLLDDEWILSYAAGALPQAHALIVASHIDRQPALQETLAKAEALGGAFLDEQVSVAMNCDSFDTIWSRIEADNDQTPLQSERTASKQNWPQDFPAPLQSWLSENTGGKLKWRLMGPGLWQMKLAEGPDGEKLWLLKARAGTTIPIHDHKGQEFTLVLTGSYQVDGKDFGPGMIEVAGCDKKNHQPVIGDQECICLVVTEAPIRLHSMAGRLLQPLIGL